MGRTLALELGRRGCHLALSDINEAGLAETARQATALGVKVTTRKLDVANRADVHAWADEVVRDHGRVNLIFNNAGVAIGATVEGMPYEELEWLLNINYWGVVHGTKAFLPHLRASGEGHIINTSSVLGMVTVASQSAYCSAKFAVRGFTECLRQELDMLDCGVSATCVHPGGIKTNIARAARTHDSVRQIGADPTHAALEFEKTFITSAETAANVILKAVEQNKRRVLVGPDAWLIDFLVRLLGPWYQRITIAIARRQARVSREAAGA